jgi:hypothetical protein
VIIREKWKVSTTAELFGCIHLPHTGKGKLAGVLCHAASIIGSIVLLAYTVFVGIQASAKEPNWFHIVSMALSLGLPIAHVASKPRDYSLLPGEGVEMASPRSP